MGLGGSVGFVTFFTILSKAPKCKTDSQKIVTFGRKSDFLWMSKNASPRRTGEKTKKRVVIRPHRHCSARPARFIHSDGGGADRSFLHIRIQKNERLSAVQISVFVCAVKPKEGMRRISASLPNCCCYFRVGRRRKAGTPKSSRSTVEAAGAGVASTAGCCAACWGCAPFCGCCACAF